MTVLWLALRFHRLPLEAFPLDEGPAVAVDRLVVVAANTQAEARGITAGMRLAGALGLAPELKAHERDPAREAATLQQLACWAGGFSSQVSIANDAELLIEIGASLRLFGGLRALGRRMRAELAAQNFSVHLALAPTPQAAQWLARAGRSGMCFEAEELPAALAPLGVAVLELAPAACSTLAALGVKRLGDLFALPRAGLARRFGSVLVRQIVRALGEEPDLRPVFVFPEVFAQRIELPAKVEHSAMLLFAAHRLLAVLTGWLGARGAGVTQCEFSLIHEPGCEPTRLVLHFAGATHDLARMERVLREHLDRCKLPAPVTDLRLDADAPVSLPGATAGLFAQSSAQALAPVVERLRARLGRSAVHGLAVCEDHRPECATRHVAQGSGTAYGPVPPRPLWLLPEPLALREHPAGLEHHGRLRRVAGPERIESGWWDQGEHAAHEADGARSPGDLRRDYYIALSEAGQWLWIFRDAQGWWLHGHFA